MSNESDTVNKPRQEIEKSRYITFILYPDNEYHSSILPDLLNNKDCVGVLHNKDTDENGELKKEHYHFIYKFDYPATKGSFLKLFPEYEDNLIKLVASIKVMSRYLLHLDDPDKTLYDFDNLVGNISIVRRYIFTTGDIICDFEEIADYIINNSITSFAQVYLFCKHNSYIQALRHFQYAISKIIDDIRGK